MYVRTIIAYPAIGKGAELEAITREGVAAAQAAGTVMSLSVRVFSGVSALVSRTIVSDMSGVAALRAGATAPGGRALVARVEPLLREPLTAQLHEVLLPIPAGGAAAATYAMFARLYPALGQTAAVLSLTLAEAKAQQEQGIPVSISRLVIAPEGGYFTAAYPLADLPALEQLIQSLSANPRWQAYSAQLSALSRQPAQQTLEEVLIPFPG
jgi:hypothetical protein